LLRKESAIDCTGPSGTGVVGFSGGGKNVLTHVLAELLRVPAERRLIKLGHPISIVKGHFEVNDAVHDGSPVHSCGQHGRISILRRRHIVFLFTPPPPCLGPHHPKRSKPPIHSLVSANGPSVTSTSPLRRRTVMASFTPLRRFPRIRTFRRSISSTHSSILSS